jgi:hypothetical protein
LSLNDQQSRVLSLVYSFHRVHNKSTLIIPVICQIIAILFFIIFTLVAPELYITVLIILSISLFAFQWFGLFLIKNYLSTNELTIEDFPTPHSRDSLSLLDFQGKHIVNILSNARRQEFRGLILLLLLSILINICWIVITYILFYNLLIYNITVVLLFTFTNVIHLVLINNSKFSDIDNSFQKWNEIVLKYLELSKIDWENNREEIIKYQVRNLEELSIIKKVIPLLNENKDESYPAIKVYSDIEFILNDYPDLTTLNKGLELGFIKYLEYRDAMNLNIPNKYEYDKFIKFEAPDYITFKEAEGLGFNDFVQYKIAMEKGCKTKSEYMELVNSGFIELDYQKYTDALKHGFSLFNDYKDAEKKGFTNYDIYQIAKQHQIPNNQEYLRVINFGIPIDQIRVTQENSAYQVFQDAITNGFESYAEYVKAKARGFTNKEQMIKIIEAGFIEYEEYEEARSQGFSSVKELKEVTALGFKNKYEYDNALAQGCQTAAQWEIINNEGFKSYEDYIASNAGKFENASQFYIAKKLGVPNLQLMKTVIETGFNSFDEYKTAIHNGFLTKDHYIEAMQRGAPTADILEEMDITGFKTYDDYKAASDLGFSNQQDYLEATSLHAPNYNIFQQIKIGKFPNYEVYKNANELGYNDYKTYLEGNEIGANNYDEFLLLQQSGTKRPEYIKLKSNYLEQNKKLLETLKNSFLKAQSHLEHANDDYYALKIAVEILTTIMNNIRSSMNHFELEENIFPEISEKLQFVEKQFVELKLDVEDLLNESKTKYYALRDVLNLVRQFTVPSYIPLFHIDEIIEKYSIDMEYLAHLINRYFTGDLKIELEAKVLAVNAWIESPEERESYKDLLRDMLLKEQGGMVLGLGVLKDRIEYPGTSKQFNSLIDSILSTEEKLGEVDFNRGIIKIPDVDYFMNNYTPSELRENIRVQIKDKVVRSDSPIHISAIAIQLGSPNVTISFLSSLTDVLTEFPAIKYNSTTGLISPPSREEEIKCPICRGKMTRGQKLGRCPECLTEVHYNEMMHYVMNKKQCPQCSASLIIESIYQFER